MKYLLESTDYEKEQTLKEICYDLTDNGFDVRFFVGLLQICKSLPDYFKLDDNLKEAILRIFNYLRDDFIKIKIHASGHTHYYPRRNTNKPITNILPMMTK